MTEAYGGLWARQYGLAHEGAFDTWEKALLDYTVEDIARGFEKAIRQNIEYPPNLPQFMELCKPPPKPVPHVEYGGGCKSSPEFARPHLDEMRQILGMKSKASG